MRKAQGSAYDKWNISWSFVTQIFHNGEPSHGGNHKMFEVMISTLPKGTLGSVIFLLGATLHQGNPDRNHVELMETRKGGRA